MIRMEKELGIFKALSDGTRLKIVLFLLDGERCVCEIMPYINRAQPTTSLQLQKLENLGIVSSRREGKSVYYQITCPEVVKVLRCLKMDGWAKDLPRKKSNAHESRNVSKTFYS
jgi:DNA-binding transcriptional ArsR family regulator